MPNYGPRSLTVSEADSLVGLLDSIDRLTPALTCADRSPLYSWHRTRLETSLAALVGIVVEIQAGYEPLKETAAEPATAKCHDPAPQPMPSYTGAGHSADEMPF